MCIGGAILADQRVGEFTGVHQKRVKIVGKGCFGKRIMEIEHRGLNSEIPKVIFPMVTHVIITFLYYHII